MTNPMPDYMTSLMRQQEATNLILVGAELVSQGGVEGIQQAALEQPELILDVIQMLVDLARENQKEIVFLAEGLAGTYDIIESTPAPK